MRKYSATLNTNSLDKLIKDLEEYKDSLKYKTEVFVSRLLDVGVKTAENVPGIDGTFGSHKMENRVSYYKELDPQEHGCYGVMVGFGDTIYTKWGEHGEKSGSINAMMALEFGTAGFAGSKTTMFGVTGGRGTNSKYGHENDILWYFAIGRDEDDNLIWKKATAIAPTRPMLQASEEMQKQIVKIAKEVFGK